MASIPYVLDSRVNCVPTFFFDRGHEDRLIVSCQRPLYLVTRGEKLGVFSGWNATQISIWKTREAPFGERSKYEKVESWEAALDLWNKFHEGGIIGPHVCSSTFTCEESGFAGASLGPTTPLSVPSRTPLSHQPPPPSSPDIPPSPSIPSTPTTPSRSRRQATQSAPSPHPRKTKRFPFTPNVAATFSPTPADPSQLINRARSQSTSPVRSQPLSSPIQEQSQSQSRRYNWFVVWTTESSTTQIFDNMARAQDYMNEKRDSGFRVHMSAGRDLDIVLAAWPGFDA